MSKPYDYDVIIVGAGPVGLCLAIALGEQGLSVCMVDHLKVSDVLKATYDGRTTAISFGSSLILEKWGVWSTLTQKNQTQPINKIFVSTQDSTEALEYSSQDVDNNPMGYIIENINFRKALFERIAEFPNITIRESEKVTDLSPSTFASTLNLESGQNISASLVIAADGRHSFLRTISGFEPRIHDYKQTAYVCVIKHHYPHEDTAYEHFIPSGPMAFLPMAGGYKSSVVWTLPSDPETMESYQDDDAVVQGLETYFKPVLGSLELEGKVWKYPLDLVVNNTYYAPRFALIGDAAHAIHPVAGQGFNVGLRDTEVLAELIGQHHGVGLDIGSQTLLKEYQKRRKPDVLSMTAATDGLVRLFSNDIPGLKQLRALGLATTNKIKPLKKILTRHAMGL